MSYVDDNFLAVLNQVEEGTKEAEAEIEAAGTMSKDIIANLQSIHEQGEDVGILAEDYKIIMEARSTVHINPEVIKRIFENFNAEFWMQTDINVDRTLEVIKNAQNLTGGYI